MQRRKTHRLSDEVFEGQNHIVSVTVCTAERSRWMGDPDLASIVRDGILELHVDHRVVGFCIMPDHAHLLICNAGTKLSTLMRGFKGRISRRVRLKKPGLTVWHSSYWDHIVRREEGLYPTLQYILQNPVRAGLVEFWWDYKWLGVPIFGEIDKDFFNCPSPENIVWREVLGGGH